MTETRTSRVAIVGAGPAGLACANALKQRGFAPVIFEKSRGIGGRVATRRRDSLQIDHGAQVLMAANGAAADLISAAQASGRAKLWAEGSAAFAGEAWVGVPGMKDLMTPLADECEITFGTAVTSISRNLDKWTVETEADAREFDAVVLAIPAPQVLGIARSAAQELVAQLEPVTFDACCTLMVEFQSRPDLPDIQTEPGGPFALILRDSAKPDRPSNAEFWLVHADAHWSAIHLETERPDIAALLIGELQKRFGALPKVRKAVGHRWRYARVSRTLGAPYAESAHGTLLAGGDWALGRNIEDALRSGAAMAHALAARLAG